MPKILTPAFHSFCFLLYCLLPAAAFAIDSESNREDVVSPRSKKLYKTDIVRSYISLGGGQTSDYNSKNNRFNARYFYQNQNFINEINLQNEVKYADRGSGKNKKYGEKTSELYDAAFSTKMRISDGQNYIVGYHRTIYDDMSKYYYDLHTAAGIGRMFFGGKIELDCSLGYHDVKNYGHEVNLIPSIRTNLQLTKNLTFLQRGYWFIDRESTDNELKTSLVYRIKKRTSLEIRHTFEQRRYENDNRNVTNQVSRAFTIGMVFDLN